jgi:DNA-binding NarL/FixJ family response regulator
MRSTFCSDFVNFFSELRVDVIWRYLERMADLTPPREHQVAKLVASGYANKEIGRRLKISEQTVKNHIQSIFRKLALNNRVELRIQLTHKSSRLRRVG